MSAINLSMKQQVYRYQPDEIVKGYEYEKDSYIIVNEKDFDKKSLEVFKNHLY